MTNPLRFFTLPSASAVARSLGLRFAVVAAYPFKLNGADWRHLTAYHERPEESREGLGCVDLRALGWSLEVFYRPLKGTMGA